MDSSPLNNVMKPANSQHVYVVCPKLLEMKAR